jgi:hypothetical protein
MRTPSLIASCAAAVLALAVPGAAQPPRDPAGEFVDGVRTYVSLHRALEQTTPAQSIFTDPVAERSAVDALAHAIRAARPNAREGDIFSPRIREDFRRRINRALRAAGLEPRTLVDEMIEDTEEGAFPVEVNGPFPWLAGNVMLPCVLSALPTLPTELEYRFVGTDLVLVDIHPNLVVDVLRDVLPATTRTRRD